ncbi:hypothetical protein [Kamptonema formosum]|uniref:hypothetical protein n=1 Tax=Kamptonema formosum TaxID=331992 RepID=UPI0012DDA381|nr:hypothetical protein [Oscillatoria sp. PCC 10802]
MSGQSTRKFAKGSPAHYRGSALIVVSQLAMSSLAGIAVTVTAAQTCRAQLANPDCPAAAECPAPSSEKSPTNAQPAAEFAPPIFPPQPPSPSAINGVALSGSLKKNVRKNLGATAGLAVELPAPPQTANRAELLMPAPQPKFGDAVIAEGAGSPPTLAPEPAAPGEQQFIPERVPLRPSRNRQQRQRLIASPSVTSVTPSAYGKSWGSAGVGVGFQGRTRYTDKSDGAIAYGMGFGDSREAVGLDVGVTVFNLSDSFGDRGGVSFKLHRALPDDFAVALGWQNAIVWGKTDAGSSVYGAVTKMFRLQESTAQPFSRLFVTAGMGSGQFRSEFDINKDIGSIAGFGSVAVRVAEPVSAIAEWTGQDLTLAVSFIPFRNQPLVITPALTDITNNAGDGARFILGIGYGFYFR